MILSDDDELKDFDLKSKTDVAYDIVNFVKNKH